jgi:dihydrofolate reductase
MLSLILARTDGGVIGRESALPWRLSEDMRRFKAMTMGKPCIMGRKTWDSLPKKPLPGRANIVASRNPAFAADGAMVAPSFEAAVKLAGEAPEIMVIGGAGIFAAALPQAGRIYLTEIHAAFSGDVVFFLPPPQAWAEVSREDRISAEGMAYSLVTLERRSPE